MVLPIDARLSERHGNVMAVFSFPRALVLVGGGALSAEVLDTACAALGGDPPLVAADGAGDRLWSMGRQPSVIIGDLDSLEDPGAWASRGVAVHHVAEQDSTDFDKCLRLTSAPLYLGVGFTGRRLDHTLAVLNAMSRHPDKAVVLLSEDDCVLHLRAGLRLGLPLGVGAPVSLFPLRPVRPGHCGGLVWPLQGLLLAPSGLEGGVIGTSNRASGSDVTLEMQDDGVLALLPPGALTDVLNALTGDR
ncbi:MAG: thiamine diphosphokinase [Pseudomonadota bacterium]